jgi:hypothetical protein
MTSKLTTICGAVGLVAGVVAVNNFTPLVTKIAACVATCANSLGLYFARDNKVSDEKAGAAGKG